jgi:RimJ/RimL family protein N-acetyltransferase
MIRFSGTGRAYGFHQTWHFGEADAFPFNGRCGKAGSTACVPLHHYQTVPFAIAGFRIFFDQESKAELLLTAATAGKYWSMNNGLFLSKRPDLVTRRLSLRRPNDDDVDAIVNIVGNWDVARRLARAPHPYGPADARYFLEQVVPAEWVWAITLQGSGAFLGAVGLTPEEGADMADLGYWLSPAHWGQGFTTEAARAVVSFGFERVGFSFLTSGYFADNPASGQVLRKLGFAEVGRTMRPCLAAGSEVPAITMELPRPV